MELRIYLQTFFVCFEAIQPKVNPKLVFGCYLRNSFPFTAEASGGPDSDKTNYSSEQAVT
jgi:hypothetical protein